MRALIVAGVLAAVAPLAPESGPRRLLTIPQNDRLQTAMSGPSSSVSANGRHVAFSSYAPLAPADRDAAADVYVLDRTTGAVTLESMSADGQAIDGQHSRPRLSGDGRYIVFERSIPAQSGVDPGTDVIVRDRVEDRAFHVCQRVGGNGWCTTPAISEDGQFVAFASTATNLVPGTDENGNGTDVYLLRAATRAIIRVSVDSLQRQPPRGASFSPAISADGRHVAFASTANLDNPARSSDAQTEPLPRISDVYLRDVERGTTRRISAGNGGQLPDGSSRDPAVSRGGAFVAFASEATNLIGGDRNRLSDVFLVETATGATRLYRRSLQGGSARAARRGPAMSADGRFVAFQSDAPDLVCARRCDPAREDINLLPDVFLYDRSSGRVSWISVDAGPGWMEESSSPSIDATGSVVSFGSRHSIDAEDIDHDYDLFVCVIEEG